MNNIKNEIKYGEIHIEMEKNKIAKELLFGEMGKNIDNFFNKKPTKLENFKYKIKKVLGI